MSYPTIALIFLAGLGLTLILALIKAADPRVPWLAVLAPFVLAWIVITYDWLYLIFFWHYQPPFPWESISLVAFLYLLALVLIRVKRSAAPRRGLGEGGSASTL